MKITEARKILKSKQASQTKKKVARHVVRIADYRNLLSRSKAKLIGLRFNPSNKELSAEARKAKDFKFWTKVEGGTRPFARGVIPLEAESAPGLNRMYDAMLTRYGERGRSVFYAQMRKISPASRLMRHVFSILKKIVVAKQNENTEQLKQLRDELTRIRRLVTAFENFREQKQYARAALELKKIDLLL
jgi:hypothetical protein